MDLASFAVALLGMIGTLCVPVSSQVIVNEVADKGSSPGDETCNNTGADWVELYLPSAATSSVDLTGFILHDDSGAADGDAFKFPVGSTMNPGEHLLLCLGNANDPMSPQFGIGGRDEVALVNPFGAVVSTTGPLQGRGVVDVSFAYDESTASYVYTSTATPGQPNDITLLPVPETVEEMRARLIAQNELGNRFFNMDKEGLEVKEGAFDALVDMHMTVDSATWQKMNDERSYELYNPFESVHVTALNEPEAVLANLTSPGRFRSKGQSNVIFGTCLDRIVPYSIDFDYTNSSQTLFGVQRGYLRMHFSDQSYVREWAVHRMLARFGLPHLRTRSVRFHVNGDYVGLYAFMEAPDQDYVFHRSFPDFDPDNYGLYKMKTLSRGCGKYDAGALQRAEAMVNTTDKPPYNFERGEHRPKIPVLGKFAFEACAAVFGQTLFGEADDVVLAYLRADKDCAEMLVAEGLVDRDLGSRSLDSEMEVFIANNLADNECDAGCSNSNLDSVVDTTQMLRNFAVMAALLHQDSPLGNGNNYYLASTGRGDGWKMVQYDHDNVMSAAVDIICGSGDCTNDQIRWSIERPTCGAFESNQIAGPLLTNKELHSEYLKYVKEFVMEVMSNEEMINQIANHLLALKDHISDDPWNDSTDSFELELAEGANWLYEMSFGVKYIPFLPALKARSEEIMKQLDAIEDGTFPRDLDDIQPEEVCIDWVLTEARSGAGFLKSLALPCAITWFAFAGLFLRLG